MSDGRALQLDFSPISNTILSRLLPEFEANHYCVLFYDRPCVAIFDLNKIFAILGKFIRKYTEYMRFHL